MSRTNAVWPRLAACALPMALLTACGGGSDATPVAAPAEETRAQDSRTTFAPRAASAYADFEAGATGDGFKALDGAAESDRWAGVLGGAGYRIEVPKNWNGKLVMYAHGYAGTGNDLVVTTPSALRRYLLDNGFAWAASSYTKNYYDVRVGVEDTNALALEFNKIAAARGRTLAAPSRIYLTGHSMGGHITAAAIETEAATHAKNKVKYDGAMPLCGVTGDTDLFDYFGAYQALAQYFAGVPKYPTANWPDVSALVRANLFTTFSTVPTAQGLKLRDAIQNLTGGARPIFTQGFANSGLQGVVWGTFGGDGTITGILNKAVIDTNRFVFQLDADPAISAEEDTLNKTVLRSTAVAEANRLRSDGLRWIPKVNGEFSIPVVSLHTLGDMYVPFHMMQLHRQRAVAKGNGDRLVTRAIRAPSHCDFTFAEQVAGFSDLVKWVEQGVKPAGDDVLTPATVASASYGCAFTNNAASTGEPTAAGSAVFTRSLMPACPAP
jgi:hypothetical protein